MKKILLIVLIAFSFSGCEKDDICDEATSTTPKITIEFFSISAPLTSISVVKLRAKATTIAESVVFDASLPSTNPLRFLSNAKKVSLPLNTFTDNTIYELTLNSGNIATQNTGVVTFNYSKNTVFVSRACGYKITFDLTNTNSNLLTTDTNNWIKDITITKPNIENENETHIKIYF